MGETPLLQKITTSPALIPLPMFAGGRVQTIHSSSLIGFGSEEYQSQWPGTYFETAFIGRELYFRVGTDHEILHLVVDGQPPLVLINPEGGVYRLSGLGNGPHSASVLVVTESQQAPNSFGGFGIAAGEKALTPKRLSRQIEFIGDSHTVGYGNTSPKRECSIDEVWATTDNSQTFGPLTATHYQADYQINAISGRGIVRNYNCAPADALPVAYPYLLFDNKQEYADPNWMPQIIVIALGTNDFSTLLNPGERWKTRDELHSGTRRSTYASFRALEQEIMMPTSSCDAHAAQWIRMIYACGRQPTVDQASHSVPTDVAVLAAARERLVPEQACPKSEGTPSICTSDLAVYLCASAFLADPAEDAWIGQCSLQSSILRRERHAEPIEIDSKTSTPPGSIRLHLCFIAKQKSNLPAHHVGSPIYRQDSFRIVGY